MIIAFSHFSLLGQFGVEPWLAMNQFTQGWIHLLQFIKIYFNYLDALSAYCGNSCRVRSLILPR